MNKVSIFKKQSNHGFTLVELSIVLVIVGVLLYTGFGLGAAQLNAAKMRQTRDKLDKIQTALQLYYETNGALPCPAGGTTALTSASFGTGGTVIVSDGIKSNATCANASNLTSNVYNGVVPTRDLSLPDEFMMDAWNNRITYVVSKYCVDPDNWDSNSSSPRYFTYKCVDGTFGGTPSSGTPDTTKGANITVNDLSGTSRTSVNAAAYVIISHGQNGIGAWRRAGGSRITGGASTSSNEKENANFAANGTTDSYNVTYIDGLMNDGTANTSTYFDDFVKWRTAPQIQYEKDN